MRTAAGLGGTPAGMASPAIREPGPRCSHCGHGHLGFAPVVASPPAAVRTP